MVGISNDFGCLNIGLSPWCRFILSYLEVFMDSSCGSAPHTQQCAKQVCSGTQMWKVPHIIWRVLLVKFEWKLLSKTQEWDFDLLQYHSRLLNKLKSMINDALYHIWMWHKYRPNCHKCQGCWFCWPQLQPADDLALDSQPVLHALLHSSQSEWHCIQQSSKLEKMFRIQHTCVLSKNPLDRSVWSEQISAISDCVSPSLCLYHNQSFSYTCSQGIK